MPGGKKEAKAEEKKSKKVELKVRVKNQPKIEVEPEIEEISPSTSSGLKEEKAQEKSKPVKKEKIKKEKKEKTKLFGQAEGKIISENTEKDKKLIMWAGVIFFMVLIIGGWIYNARNVFKENEIRDSGEDVLDLQKWDDMTGELSEKISQMKEDLKSLKEFNGEETGLGGATTTDRMLFATSSDEFLSTTTEENTAIESNASMAEPADAKDEAVKSQLEELRKKLEALEKEVE